MDTARRDHMSLYGYERLTTPFLEQLARDSVVFERAYSTSSWTAPAHASLFTGLFPASHGVTQENWTMSEDLTSLAEWLSEAGYSTWASVGNPMLSKQRGFAQGFDSYFEAWRKKSVLDRLKRRLSDETTDDRVLARAADYLKNHSSDRPFFLFVNLIGPHSPYDSCKGVCDVFRDDESSGLTANRWKDYYLGRFQPSPQDITSLIDSYDAELLYTDSLIERLVEQLESQNLWETTVFVVTSDHGENLGDHDHWDHLFSLYETTTAIPLLIRVPSSPLQQGDRDGRVVQLTDLFPTLLDLSGLGDSPDRSQGRDLLSPDPQADFTSALLEYYRPKQALGIALRSATPDEIEKTRRFDRRLRALVVDHHKLIWGSDGSWEFYDLSVDPREQVNAIDDPLYEPFRQELLSEMEHRHDLLSAQAVDLPTQTEVSEETRKALEALGYLE